MLNLNVKQSKNKIELNVSSVYMLYKYDRNPIVNTDETPVF